MSLLSIFTKRYSNKFYIEQNGINIYAKGFITLSDAINYIINNIDLKNNMDYVVITKGNDYITTMSIMISLSHNIAKKINNSYNAW